MVKRPNLIKEYYPELAELVRRHVEEGHSFRSFSGKMSIPLQKWEKWAREIPELIFIREQYNAMVREKKKFYAPGPKAILDLKNKN
jgi:hypothetical protein